MAAHDRRPHDQRRRVRPVLIRPPALLVLTLLLGGCPEPPPAPEAPATPADPAPEPAPAATTEVVLDVDVLQSRLQIRVLAPASGAAEAESAGQAAVAEARRVAALPPDSPELVAHPHLWAYAVDRAAHVLSTEGTTDFLVTFAGIHRARGSQDGTAGRGWRVAVDGADPGTTLGTLALRDEAMASVVRESTRSVVGGRATVIAPGAVPAARRARQVADRPDRVAAAEPERGFAALYVGADGSKHADAAFAARLQGVRVPR